MKPQKIYAEIVEQAALDQFNDAMDQPFAVKGALMPDVHAGYSLPIGAVVATEGVIVPAWVGYDIGCGLCAVPTTFKREDVEAAADSIFNRIYDVVPVGFNHNRFDSIWDYSRLPHSNALAAIFAKNGLKQLASLGGGNHFIEIGYSENDTVWIITHSGSRGIGHAVATHYMKLASGDGKAREGHFGFAVNTVNGLDYINDLAFCLAFALENRRQIIGRVVDVLMEYCQGSTVYSRLINRNHNHAEYKLGLWIHRKGATHAEAGMLGVIPGNMRDGSFIVVGKGNPDSLCSSSHGAGRVLGRKEAQRVLDTQDFMNDMVGIAAKTGYETLDESPRAYKNIFDVMQQQSDLVDVLHHVKPIINIKG